MYVITSIIPDPMLGVEEKKKKKTDGNEVWTYFTY